ncbi:MAG: nuclear transport factor 2 family protein [Gemmatimonadales bacterium]|nr:nuclear transport factor 2 family protein [Gemmatimonadales bacterium]
MSGRGRAGLAAVLLALAGAAPPLQAQLPTNAPAPIGPLQTARDSVLDVIDQLFEGMRRQDSAQMRAQFAPWATLVTLDRVAPADSFLKRATPDQFVGRMLRYAIPLSERLLRPDVRIKDDLASVWAYYDVRFGDRFSHCGIDAFHLARLDGRWQIIALNWTRRREKCVVVP